MTRPAAAIAARAALTGAADPYVVQPVAKALAVLAFVEDAGHEVGLSDVARALGLPKTSAFRYLYTLTAAGFLAYGNSRDRYRAGPRLHRGKESETSVPRLRENGRRDDRGCSLCDDPHSRSPGEGRRGYERILADHV